MSKQWLNNISIKTALNIPVMLLSAMLIGSSLWIVYTVYLPQTRNAEHIGKSNLMADKLLSAAASEAQERGFTASLLSKLENGQSDDTLYQAIKTQRANGDAALFEAQALANELINANWHSHALKSHLDRINQYHSTAVQLRIAVDKALSGSQIPDTGKWLATMTGMILATSDLRLAAFTPYDDASSAVYINNMIKQSLWTIAEYAGRERAAIGQATATKSPLTQQTYTKLMGYRTVVDLQFSYLDSIVNDIDMSNEYRSRWEDVEKTFLGRYQELRLQIYQAAGEGNYPVNGQEWLKAATEAINTLFAVSDVVGKESSELSQRIINVTNKDFWFSSSISLISVFIALALWMYIRMMTANMSKMRDIIIESESTNNLMLRSSLTGSNELAQVSLAFNSMLSRLSGIVQQVTIRTTDAVAHVAKVIEASEDTMNGTHHLNRDMETVAAAVNEMSATIQEMARNISTTAESANDANVDADNGLKVIGQAVTLITDLSGKVEEAGSAIVQLDKESTAINQVLNVINDIAEQTNLLALNAAIEAARAGEQGRGFSVVADEVRALAARTHDSTNEIFNIIERIQKQMKLTVSVMGEVRTRAATTVEQSETARTSLVHIAERVNTISDMSAQIATGAEEQAYATEDINKSISTIATVTNVTNSAAETNSGACERIAEQMELLRQLVSQFKVGNSLDLSNAKSAHLAWKGRIFSFLHGKESLTLAQAVSHHDCVLGKWYYGEGLEKYGHYSAMKELEKPHTELHSLIRDIIKTKEAGQESKAEELAHKISPISDRIVGLLNKIEEQALQETAT